jgi:hypothetical protein
MRSIISLQLSVRGKEKKIKNIKGNSIMRRDVVYGVKDEQPDFGQFVELFMFDEDRHLGINWMNDGNATVFHFLIKDKDDYEDFKNELMVVLRDCEDIGEAYYTLEAYLNSEYIDDFLEEYPEEENSDLGV